MTVHRLTIHAADTDSAHRSSERPPPARAKRNETQTVTSDADVRRSFPGFGEPVAIRRKISLLTIVVATNNIGHGQDAFRPAQTEPPLRLPRRRGPDRPAYGGSPGDRSMGPVPQDHG